MNRRNMRPERVLLLSDIHNESGLWVPHTNLDFDTVILPGDIGKHTHGLQWAIQNFPGKKVLYVPGNHEFLDAEIHGIRSELQRLAETARRYGVDVHVLDDSLHQAGNVRFLGCTLWTDFAFFGAASISDAMMVAEHRDTGMPDYSRCRCAPHDHFSASMSASLHRKSIAWLSNELNKPFNGITVVISHFLPSARSVSERFRSSPLTAAFASHLEGLVKKSDFWFHGHTHDSFDYVLNGCRVICNPKGPLMDVAGVSENEFFNPSLVIELDSTI